MVQPQITHRYLQAHDAVLESGQSIRFYRWKPPIKETTMSISPAQEELDANTQRYRDDRSAFTVHYQLGGGPPRNVVVLALDPLDAMKMTREAVGPTVIDLAAEQAEATDA